MNFIFPKVTAKKLNIDDVRATPLIFEFELYYNTEHYRANLEDFDSKKKTEQRSKR